MATKALTFRCESDRNDKIYLGNVVNASLILGWSFTDCTCVRLSQDTCVRLVAQLQHFVNHGKLLPEEPPALTDEDRNRAIDVLAAIGVRVSPESLEAIPKD